jgi:hypothetical protein
VGAAFEYALKAWQTELTLEIAEIGPAEQSGPGFYPVWILSKSPNG